MTGAAATCNPDRAALLDWAARLGAITAEALALRDGCSLASARGRLAAAERGGWLRGVRLLADAPTLYTVTRSGLAAAAVGGIEPARVSVSSAPHAIACAAVAAALERRYPAYRLMGEHELLRSEREAGRALVSAQLGGGAGAGLAAARHRPDLALWPRACAPALPIAVEVELTVKASARLRDICRAWARCRRVAGVLYVAAPGVLRALERALADAHAGGRVLVAELAEVLAEKSVPSGA